MKPKRDALYCRDCSENHPVHPYRCRRYEGWANYETWAVKLWIDNEHSSYEYWREKAAEAKANPEPNQFASGGFLSPGYSLARELKDEIQENGPDLGASMYADLLVAAFAEVNWDEIADSLLEALEEA